jgi:hypothetical protein
MSGIADYWRECIASSAEECGAVLTEAQVAHIADVAAAAHENFGLACYQPNRSEDIRREHAAEVARLKAEAKESEANAEAAVRKAFRIPQGTPVSIGAHGEVRTHGGRTEVVQW